MLLAWEVIVSADMCHSSGQFVQRLIAARYVDCQKVRSPLTVTRSWALQGGSCWASLSC